MKTKLTIVTALFIALVWTLAATTAHAAGPRPQCAPKSPKCHVTYVSYTYTQRGHDQYGDQFVRTCHVPAYGKRWCGPWRIVAALDLRTAVPMHHLTKQDLYRLLGR